MWFTNLKGRWYASFLFLLLFLLNPGTGYTMDIKGLNKRSAGLGNSHKSISLLEMQRISDRLSARMSTLQMNQTTCSPLLKAMAGKSTSFYSIRELNSWSGKKEGNVYWHEKNSTPIFIQINPVRNVLSTQSSKPETRDAAEEFIRDNRSLFRIENPDNEFQVVEESEDAEAKKHIKFNQYYMNLPVWGHDLVVHLDENNQVYAVNARYSPTPNLLDVNKSGISDQVAVIIAISDIEKTSKMEALPEWAKKIMDYQNPPVKKYIWYEDKTGQPYIVWHVQIRPNMRDNWAYFIDVQTGVILEKYNSTNFDGAATSQATDLNGDTQTIHSYQSGSSYYLIDASRPVWQTSQSDVLNDPKGGLVTLDANNHDADQNLQLYHVTSQTNTWTDPVSVSAHSNMGTVFDYFYNTHGRQAIDNNGSTVISLIHVTQIGKPMDNAYWNGAIMLYGDGNVAYEALAGGVDVAAHEMTHGVTQHTVGLEYKFQSGALNESVSDVFGVMVDREDWRVGEDIVKLAYYPSGALRDMENPHNGGSTVNDLSWQPAHMSEFVDLDISEDNGGVHINSGIPNHACYLIGNAIGKDKTEKIYYRVLDARYLNKQSNFIDMRLAAVQAAKDLYGDGSAEVNAVNAAFDGVGIGSSGGSQPDPDVPPVSGEEWIATVDWTSESLFLVKPVIQNPETDIKLLTLTAINTETGNPISVTDDGSLIIFVDKNHLIRVINSDGSGEEIISENPVWNSIALSPNGKTLAATTTLMDSSIYFFDFSGNNNHKKIRLYTPATQENIRNYLTVFADAMDWNSTSEYLIYDSFTSIPSTSGGNLEYWNVNILNPETEIISMLFPPQTEGISIGNPSFGQTNDIYFVFDYIDINQNSYQIRSANLFTGEIFLIEDNQGSIGYPRYSSDDRNLVFQRWQSEGNNVFPVLRQIALKESKTESAGNSAAFLNDGILPDWFTIGSRPTSLEDHANPQPGEFSLSQNYPNPFNPRTTIHYYLEKKEKIKLTVFNILGDVVSILAEGEQAAGSHNIVFDGSNLASGIYLYQLKTESKNETRRMLYLK